MAHPKNYIATDLRTACLCVCAMLTGMLLPDRALAQSIGIVTDVSGPLLVRKADGAVKVLSQQSHVDQGDLLETASNTYARIKFIDNEQVTLRPDTQFKINVYSFDQTRPDNDAMEFSLIKGGMRSVTGLMGQRNKDKFRLNTPSGSVGIRGTNFGALFCQSDCGSVPSPSGTVPQNGLYVDVTQGAIIVTNTGGSQNFQAGQFGYIANLNSPPVIIPPAQGIPISIPPSMSQNTPPGTTGGAKPGDVDCVVR